VKRKSRAEKERRERVLRAPAVQTAEKSFLPLKGIKGLAEFRRPQAAESIKICFFRGHAPREKLFSGRKRVRYGACAAAACILYHRNARISVKHVSAP
jgi:hypothetical protein